MWSIGLIVKKTFTKSIDPMENLLRETNNGSELIESKDTIIINLTNNFVENKEEASHGTLMAKVSILITMMIVIVFQFQ